MADTKLTLQQRILAIQSELKAPKGQRNTFGKYNYRSAEDILEAVKPLLKKYGVLQLITDDLVAVEGRFYVKATVRVQCAEGGGEEVLISAFAREEETKKGMDSAQVTGSTSSYARKYALNGLWAIDDTKDADTDEYTKQTQEEHPRRQTAQTKNVDPPASKKELEDLYSTVQTAGIDGAIIAEVIRDKFKKTSSRELTSGEAQWLKGWVVSQAAAMAAEMVGA